MHRSVCGLLVHLDHRVLQEDLNVGLIEDVEDSKQVLDIVELHVLLEVEFRVLRDNHVLVLELLAVEERGEQHDDGFNQLLRSFWETLDVLPLVEVDVDGLDHGVDFNQKELQLLLLEREEDPALRSYFLALGHL